MQLYKRKHELYTNNVPAFVAHPSMHINQEPGFLLSDLDVGAENVEFEGLGVGEDSCFTKNIMW